MEGVEIPSFFLCPVSLQIMRDPVTLSTGISYDRASIERWMRSGKRRTCPVTKQTLVDTELTPNHTLQRVIQGWCAVNEPAGVDQLPSPRPPVDKAMIDELIQSAKAPEMLMDSLHELGEIVSESDTNKRTVEATAGAIDFLASIIESGIGLQNADDESEAHASDEALKILSTIQLSEQGLVVLIAIHGDFVESLAATMRRSNDESRSCATLILKSLIAVISPARLVAVKHEVYQEIVRSLQDRISHQTTKVALQILMELCLWGRNRAKAAEAGAATALIELLLDDIDRRECERMLAVLDQLCRCAEGRAAVIGHAAGIAVLSKKMTGVSHAATGRAVRILYLLSKISGSPAVVQEMLQMGVVSKLCSLLEADCEAKTKEKVKEMLSMHYRVWRNSRCIIPHLLHLYPR